MIKKISLPVVLAVLVIFLYWYEFIVLEELPVEQSEILKAYDYQPNEPAGRVREPPVALTTPTYLEVNMATVNSTDPTQDELPEIPSWEVAIDDEQMYAIEGFSHKAGALSS